MVGIKPDSLGEKSPMLEGSLDERVHWWSLSAYYPHTLAKTGDSAGVVAL